MLVDRLWIQGPQKTPRELLKYLPERDWGLKCFVPEQNASNSEKEDAVYQRLQRMDKVTEFVKTSWTGRLTFLTKQG